MKETSSWNLNKCENVRQDQKKDLQKFCKSLIFNRRGEKI